MPVPSITPLLMRTCVCKVLRLPGLGDSPWQWRRVLGTQFYWPAHEWGELQPHAPLDHGISPPKTAGYQSPQKKSQPKHTSRTQLSLRTTQRFSSCTQNAWLYTTLDIVYLRQLEWVHLRDLVMWWPLMDSGCGSTPSAQSSKIREIFIQVILTIFKMMSLLKCNKNVRSYL